MPGTTLRQFKGEIEGEHLHFLDFLLAAAKEKTEENLVSRGEDGQGGRLNE